MPMVFHSFCSLMSLSEVAFQSVESMRALACSTISLFFLVFSAKFSFRVLKNSALRPKKSSQAARKRSNILTFIFCGAKPMVFHSVWMSIICLVWFSQSVAFLFSSLAMASTFSQSSVLRVRFSSSLARSSSKCCWWRLLMTVEAALKRAQICSRSSLATGPISRYCWCSSCNWWKALTASGSSASFSAASQSSVFCSRFFLKSYSRSSRLRLSRS